VWKLGDGPFQPGLIAPRLTLRPDSPHHGTIQPAVLMPLKEYEEALAATREDRVIDESGA
jgi:hypothetical protein